jgi:hypothetical protein
MTYLFFRLALGVLLTLGIGANAQGANQAKPEEGPHEGIKVHGHWTIEVRNPDGKLVTHREFENSLDQNAGAATLVIPLDRSAVGGLWMVALGSSSCPATSPFCLLTESASSVLQNTFRTLTVTESGSQTTNPHLVLSGTMTAPQSGSVNFVQTLQLECAPTVAPANCLETNALGVNPPRGGEFGYGIFTSTLLNPFISVSAGQLIQVTVDISFS